MRVQQTRDQRICRSGCAGRVCPAQPDLQRRPQPRKIMQPKFSQALVLFSLLVAGCASSQPATQPSSQRAERPFKGDGYANPIDVLIADPFIYHEGETYYLYGTAAD